MKLLVTGYPGWLTNRFIETKNQYQTVFESIRCLALPSSKIQNHQNIEMVYGDLSHPDELKKAVRDQDVVLHAAGVLHVKKISDFYAINCDGTRNLLNACIEGGVQRFIFISSNAAQGFCENKNQRLCEADPCQPNCDYGRSKYEAEKAVNEFHAGGKIKATILRPAMFYGPPVAKRHLEIYKKIQKGSFPVFGTGEYCRSVTYIDNLIQAIHLALNQTKPTGSTYTITDREIPTLVDIIKTIGSELGVNVKIIHYPRWMAEAARILDVVLTKMGIYWMLPHIVGESHKNIAYSIEKAERELGYNPTVNYKEGYKRVINWCREQNLVKSVL